MASRRREYLDFSDSDFPRARRLATLPLRNFRMQSIPAWIFDYRPLRFARLSDSFLPQIQSSWGHDPTLDSLRLVPHYFPMKKAPGFQTIGHSPNCNRPGFWAELSGESTERTRRRALASHFLAYRGQILNKLSSPTLPLFTEIYV